MDIFDRLGNLIKTILDEGSPNLGSGSATNDPDMKKAWEELEDYMRKEEPRGGSAAGPQGAGAARPASDIPEWLRKDFRNLEVPFGAPLSEVRRSYKKLMAAFHPDRHSENPDRFRTATEVTKKLNQSFQRIESYYEAKG